ncbi:MAG: sugar-binding transcriptional regulator [Caldicoprobacterales bacterium]|jgi:deoxyribonucleoside regulator
MQDNTDYTMLYRIAKYYYIDNMSQSEIALKEHMSRPHVSRLLEKARQVGIVEINVTLPEKLQVEKTAKILKKRLGLQDVIVAQAPMETKNLSKKISMNIATAAAQNLPKLLRGCHTIGVGWGYTMYQTSLQLPYCDSIDATFVPLVGISGENNPFLQINAIVDRFAEKFGADSYYINIPAIREKDSQLAQIEIERFNKIKQYWKSLDAAIIGLGVSPNVGEFLVSEVSKEYKEAIARSNTLGDILCQFFYQDGTLFDFRGTYEQTFFSVKKLKNIKKVVCLAGGAAKVEGIITAARQGFFNILITDSNTASLILEKT